MDYFQEKALRAYIDRGIDSNYSYVDDNCSFIPMNKIPYKTGIYHSAKSNGKHIAGNIECEEAQYDENNNKFKVKNYYTVLDTDKKRAMDMDKVLFTPYQYKIKQKFKTSKKSEKETKYNKKDQYKTF